MHRTYMYTGGADAYGNGMNMGYAPTGVNAGQQQQQQQPVIPQQQQVPQPPVQSEYTQPPGGQPAAR